MADPRIFVYGASGYTGGLVMESLGGTDVPLVVAGRSREKLEPLAARYGAETLVADATTADGTITDALSPGDVLVSTVGPFMRLGGPAVKAAVTAGAHYVDSTGEGPFIREVFERWGPRAEGRSLLLTAFGYDWVPGNLASALALQEAGSDAVAVDVGYFNDGEADPRNAISSGTLATTVTQAQRPGFAFRGGRLVERSGMPDRRSFPVRGRQWQALEIPGTEHLDLPEAFPHVQDIGTYIGWLGPATPVFQGLVGVGRLASKVPGLGQASTALSKVLSKRTGIGPDEQARAKLRSLVVAEARAADGTVLSTVQLEGPNGYTLTGALIAWAAERLATDAPDATGARGPVTAFGLEELEAAAGKLGLTRTV